MQYEDARQDEETGQHKARLVGRPRPQSLYKLFTWAQRVWVEVRGWCPEEGDMKKMLLMVLLCGACTDFDEGPIACKDLLPPTTKKEEVACPAPETCEDHGHHCICTVKATGELCWADLGDIRETTK